MYLKLPDVYPYQPTQLRAENPNVSFPSEMADALLAEFDVYPVQPTSRPEYDPATQTLSEALPSYENGVWVQTWTVTNLTADEIAARTQARRAALVCTPRQARLALAQAGLLPAIEAWVAAATETTQIEWQYANEIRRDWPPIAEAATALWLSDTQLDELFDLASTL